MAKTRLDRSTENTDEDIDLSIWGESQITLYKSTILKDYKLAVESRQASLIGRREVLSGKAKFGIFGDGKEVPQLALAKVFKKGDFRSGYYRDQTLMFALEENNIQRFFAQLYAHADVQAEPASGGRQMNAHFATRSLDENGRFHNLSQQYNIAADTSPTASQMPRLVGLGYASRLYRELDELQNLTQFSQRGNEIAFGTIGNASCAEGLFWEALNAIGVLKVPVVLSIWDDGYGISVPNEFQITKRNLSDLLQGFQRQPGCDEGFDVYSVKGWDYLSLIETYAKAAQTARREHVPAIIHVQELTQPQGHSTSGSHERYKTADRLAWEAEHDCIHKMRQWIIEQGIATDGELDGIERNAKRNMEHIRERAWKAFTRPIYREREMVAGLMREIEAISTNHEAVADIRRQLVARRTPTRKEIFAAIHEVLVATRSEEASLAKTQLMAWRDHELPRNQYRFGSHLHDETADSALHIPEIKPIYSADSPAVNGFQILNACFDAILAREPRFVAFGEDLGKIGGVNQCFAGLQEKYGELRVSDTGIREATILGQGIGLAMRGLRPLAEIQYLDYIHYALQTLADDLATLHWRTAGGQKAPVIVRTRGHRLEGVWHAGSPMAGIIHLVRGVHVCVPRNMVQAAGFYNTLIQAEEPAIVVEVLNGYRLKEQLPDNVGEFTVPLGVPEVIRQGEDVTIVTYGAMCTIALEAAELLQKVEIDVEVVDVQSLLPFDVNGRILDSLKKTSRILFLDEDVPGGTTAYMMQEVIEKQGGYWHLDAEPRTLSAQAHRPPYGSDGAYFSKPNVEDIFKLVYEMMNEAEPTTYPMFYK